MYRQRRAEHRAAQRAFLVRHPGAIPDARQRIIWLSRLQLAEPALDVTAYIERTVRDLSGSIEAAGGGRGSEGRGRASGRADRSGRNGRSNGTGAWDRGGNPEGASSARPSQEPWKEDQRSEQDVIDATMPPFLSLSQRGGKPRYDREV
ncbi:MAG: hypothetical protein AVDCRST_MAG93-5774 [uncultured Chloroflexia bacterium]|uniref:Uncharacterized protein n=1 Tax=uncultured Chloroflexia bacterium TaxID=1672391 RepID=A0A6J4L3W9_9CHLR|nr:MAG: hypothetical protein AVDCRST_MAG93-5774 [uncultured Chloroflexia bacterium]